jgi:predicted metal-dependent hydrolase
VIVRAPLKLPERKIASFLQKHADWILTTLEKAKEKSEKFNALTDDDILTLKAKAKAYLTQRTEEYAEIMGLKYSRITITSAKTRFGSCSSKGNISYSYRLMLYPTEAIDYVVVHELAHLIEMNHSKRFYGIIEKVLPDYKERMRLLK